MPAHPARPDGTAYGEIRAPLDKAKLIPYLERHVAGFKGPMDIKQFGVSNPLLGPLTHSLVSRIRHTCSRRPPRATCFVVRRPASS